MTSTDPVQTPDTPIDVPAQPDPDTDPYEDDDPRPGDQNDVEL